MENFELLIAIFLVLQTNAFIIGLLDGSEDSTYYRPELRLKINLIGLLCFGFYLGYFLGRSNIWSLVWKIFTYEIWKRK